MSAVQEIYENVYGHECERRYRAKLKAKLISEFGDALQFLKIDGESPLIIVSSEELKTTAIVRQKEYILKDAGKYLSEDILDYASKQEDSSWPPSYESLSQKHRYFPSSTKEFSLLL